MNNTSRFSYGLVIGLIVLFNSSCNSYKNVVYFKDLPDSLYNRPLVIDDDKFSDPIIQPNDILEVDVQTLDPSLSGIPGSSSQSTALALSSPNAMGAMGASMSPTPGVSSGNRYLVDKSGVIDIPLAGKVKVGGLTTAEVRDTITEVSKKYFVDPVVNVKFTNFKITVLGEVSRPGQYTVPDEKISIIDAIGLAGDMTIFAKRNNVLLVHNEKGKREFIRFNLNSSETFKSSYFYLKQDDVIYVETAKSKAAATDAAQTRSISLITAICTVTAVVLSYVLFVR